MTIQLEITLLPTLIVLFVCLCGLFLTARRMIPTLKVEYCGFRLAAQRPSTP